MNQTNPIDQTIETYNTYFDRYFDRTSQTIDGNFKEWLDLFLFYLPKPSKIFELGSATGRDARYFRNNGHSVLCTDVVSDALEQLSRDGFDTSVYDFRNDLLPEWIGVFDGVFANAVLLHADSNTFVSALKRIELALTPNGICAFSLKAGIGEEISFDKMDAPRYFHYYDKDGLEETLSSLPFEILHSSYDSYRTWIHVIMRKQLPERNL